MNKPFIPAADKNKDAILAALGPLLPEHARVLEIGSGTGQHAVHFAAALPTIRWQPSDLAQALPGIRAWTQDAALPNLAAPIALDVRDVAWAQGRYDVVYAANVLHFMAWTAVESFFAGCARLLPPGGVLTVYGPFNYGGRYVSEGNRRLDAWLAGVDPDYAIRDLEAVDAAASAYGLRLSEDLALPANNRLVVWRHDGAPPG